MNLSDTNFTPAYKFRSGTHEELGRHRGIELEGKAECGAECECNSCVVGMFSV